MFEEIKYFKIIKSYNIIYNIILNIIWFLNLQETFLGPMM